jgi:hypothetical protein
MLIREMRHCMQELFRQHDRLSELPGNCHR